MSDYRVFNGAALLDQLWQRKQQNQSSEEDKTLLTILELSGLKIQEEVTKETLLIIMLENSVNMI